MKLERIAYDGESWDFSNYFGYIRGVADMLPPPLRDYSTDVDSYSLHGTKTLHDARMMSAVIKKVYDEKISNPKTGIELRFIDQLFEGEIILEYGDVSSYSFKETESNKHSHADVLVHEFSVISANLFRHRIIFDHCGGFQVEFGSFSHTRRRF